MSIFDDNITSKTQLQEFHDRIKEVIQCNFECIYKFCNKIYGRNNYSFDQSLNYTASILNHEISKFQKDFAEFGMYNPWLHCTPIAQLSPVKTKILISVMYSEDPSIFLYGNRKEFLHMSLPLPLNITTDSYEFV